MGGQAIACQGHRKTHVPSPSIKATPDGDTVLVSFIDVPEAITFGADEDEALLQAVDALETALSFLI